MLQRLCCCKLTTDHGLLCRVLNHGKNQDHADLIFCAPAPHLTAPTNFLRQSLRNQTKQHLTPERPIKTKLTKQTPCILHHYPTMAAPSTLTNPTLTASVHDPLPNAGAGEGTAIVDEPATTGAAIDSTPISPIQRRDSLEKHLQTRPEAKDLRERGILHGSEGQSPAIQAKARDLERARAADSLKKELSSRPDAQDLRERNILHGNDGQSP